MQVNEPAKALHSAILAMYVLAALLFVATLFGLAYEYGGALLVASLLGLSVIVAYIQRHIIQGEPYVN